MIPREEYYRTLARKRGSAGVLFIKDGKLLVLEPTYKAGLEIPGGTIDKDEAPRETAIRECQEELGITPQLTQYLCVDYRLGDKVSGDALHHIFLGDMGNQDVCIDHKEIGGFKWLPMAEALAQMSKDRPDLAARVGAAISVINSGKTAYCEEGKQVFPTPPVPKSAVPKMAAPKIKPPRI